MKQYFIVKGLLNDHQLQYIQFMQANTATASINDP